MKRLKKNLHQRSFCILSCLLLAAIFWSCSSKNSSEETSSFDPNHSYFPDQVSVDHAIGFDVTYHKNWKELQLFRHYNDFVDTVRYALVQRGTPKPEGFEETRTIQVPVQQVGSLSTTHLGMFEMLDALDQLKGVETATYVSSEKVRALVDQQRILELAPTGMLNTEVVLASGIEVLLGVGYPNSQNTSYQELENAGVPVLLNADWQEVDLLGRAEWVKMVAVLLNKEKQVNEAFSKIEKEYNEVLQLVNEKVEQGPITITGMVQGDAWYVSGGKSFGYQVLKTAKVNYPWSADNSTGSLKLDFETVYEFGLKADYWMVPGSAKTLDDIIQRDSRFRDFKSYQDQQIYNIYGRYTEGGGNDYYESGIVNPHVILKDVVSIFHPELLPNHELVYYARLK
ncbi:MAG: ABC transporter substrate-binding protein [Cytophagia bacterium]|nr:ABC transporter substrate-binding protein [Cytophagia bacterium]